MKMKNLTIPLKFDLGQFLRFFTQLSPENKELIFNALKAAMQTGPVRVNGDSPLQGTVLKYDHPFQPVAENDWGAIA